MRIFYIQIHPDSIPCTFRPSLISQKELTIASVCVIIIFVQKRVISSVGQSYRLITGWSWVQVPDDPPKKERSSSLVLFLSKPQVWYIITALSVVYIISPFGAGYHHGIAVYTFPAV